MIYCRFRCEECHCRDTLVLVPARTDPESDVKHYMESIVMSYVADSHTLLSPDCKCRKVSLCLAIGDKDDPEPWIGKPTTNIPPTGLFDKKEGDA